MIKSITPFQYKRSQQETLDSVQKIETYEILLPKYVLDNHTGIETTVSHTEDAKLLNIDDVKSFVFFDMYNDTASYVVATKEDLLQDPILLKDKTVTLDDIKKEKEESKLATFMKEKQRQVELIEYNNQMARQSSFNKIEFNKKQENRKLQVKLNFMNDFGFYPTLDINTEKESGSINIEFKDGDTKSIPLKLIEEDIKLEIPDLDDYPVYVIDVDSLYDNDLFKAHFKNNKHLTSAINDGMFISEDNYDILSENSSNQDTFITYNIESETHAKNHIIHTANQFLDSSIKKRKKNNKLGL
jgi:hypothetical protein